MWWAWTMDETLGCYKTLKEARWDNFVLRASRINWQGIREYAKRSKDRSWTLFIAEEKVLKKYNPELLRDLKKELTEKE